MAGSLEQALAFLQQQQQRDGDGGARQLGRVFVIGGAQIYGAALALGETKRILLTRVLSDFECDTKFPLELGGEEGAKAEAAAAWKRSSQAEFDAWVGEAAPAGIQEENGTQYEFQMWERLD